MSAPCVSKAKNSRRLDGNLALANAATCLAQSNPAQNVQNESGLPLIADMERTCRHVADGFSRSLGQTETFGHFARAAL